MYFPQKVHDTSSNTERKNLIQTIKNGSMIAWQHINLQGEYDFFRRDFEGFYRI